MCIPSFVSGILLPTFHSQDLSVLLQVVVTHSFYLLYSIPSCEFTAIYLWIIWLFSSFSITNNVSTKFSFFKFIYFRRKRVNEQWRGRERESQAGSVLSAQSPLEALISGIMRS